MSFRLRVKTSSSNLTLTSLTPESSVSDLLSASSENGGSSASEVTIKTGFPPQKIKLEGTEQTLKELGISNGDCLHITVASCSSSNTSSSSSSPTKRSSSGAAVSKSNDHAGLRRQVVPDDNNCLFTAVHFCIAGRVDPETAKGLRQVIPHVLESQQEKYPEAVLGKTRDEYSKWILKEASWGGAIEAQILAEHFGIVITVIDTKSGSMTDFGEGIGSSQRMLLVYDGIHYDALCKDEGENRTLFPVHDAATVDGASSFCRAARAEGKFTDVYKFTLKCNDCGARMQGQREAQEHAKKTGHGNFGEVSA